MDESTLKTKKELEATSEHMHRIYPTGTSRINWLGDLIFADARDLRIPIDRVRLLKPRS